MPIQAGDLNRIVVSRRISSSPCEVGDHGHESNSNHHVQRVQPGHREVQREEYLDVLGIRMVEVEVGSRHFMRHPVLVVLDSLDSQEAEPENHREYQKDDRELAVAHLCIVNGKHHRQA